MSVRTHGRKLAMVAVVASLAVTGLAGTASAAQADILRVTTTAEVLSPPYDARALIPSGGVSRIRRVWEGDHPVTRRERPSMPVVAIKVRHQIQCLRGTERRAGYGRYCYWSSQLGGNGDTATVGTRQDGVNQNPPGDVFAGGWGGYPVGTSFHSGYQPEGSTRLDEWLVSVRNDEVNEPDERFHLTVRGTAPKSEPVETQGTPVTWFVILDDERRSRRVVRDVLNPRQPCVRGLPCKR